MRDTAGRMRRTRTFLAAAAWLLAVVVIALGAAGLATAMDGPPPVGERGGQAFRGDAQVIPVLDAAEAELEALVIDVQGLSTQGRGALVSFTNSDPDTASAAIAEGDRRLLGIQARAAAVARLLDEVPLIGTPRAAYEVSPAVLARYARLVEGPAAVRDLPAQWARLSVGALAADRLSRLLTQHDEAVIAAAAQGRDADYASAIITLDDADAAISGARDLSESLSETVDVTVLDEWLQRNAEYDAALRALYTALDGVGGRVTDEVRAAIDAEQAAKDRLPPDGRGLIVIMSEIGRGWMNGAVIAIEEARGSLARILTAPPAETAPAPTAAP